MSSAVAIVPAAGASSRFGSMKLLAAIAGEPLLQHTLRHLLEAGIPRIVLVVAPGHGLDVVPMVRDVRVTTVINPDPSRGMFSSIQAGLAAADGDPLVILPADMPFTSAAVIARMVEAAGDVNTVVVPEYGGRRGHPVVLRGRLRSMLLDANPTSNLKTALLVAAGTPPIEVAVHDSGVLKDVDVPTDL